jgi:endonuclease/exonuclease/phosphatase family metal-dependent hydrolase
MLNTQCRDPGGPRRADTANRAPSVQRLLRLLTTSCLAAAVAVCPTSATTANDGANPSCRQVLPDISFPVTWVRPSGVRDRERLDRWCDAVGPLLVEPTPASTPRPMDRLAVVVWNVHVGGGDIDHLIDALTRGDLTGGTPVPSFVLLLQEAYRHGVDVPARPPAGSQGPVAILEAPPGGTRRSVVEIAHARGLALAYAPSMRNAGLIDIVPDREDRGNAILSTQPLTDLLVIELPFERQRRVVVAATARGVTTDGGVWQLVLANAHLDTGGALTRGGPFAAHRRQAAAIVSALASQSLPTLLGGDFNSWLGDREPAVRDLRRAFPQSPPGSTAATFHGPFFVRAVLDHVFVRNPRGTVSVRRLANRFGSDHYPLLAVIDVK